MKAINKVKELLENRNLDSIHISNIPKPQSMKGVEEASEIIKNAILENKKIAIVGDYDVDGVMGVFIMELFFEEIGFSNFVTKIPNRFKDGYGINENIIDEMQSDIYITVDNGIVAFEVADKCKKENKILIITDHHKPLIVNNEEKLPDAIIINPSQKECSFLQKEICGALVAWYFCAGIKKALNAKINLSKFTPALSIATMADMMPLKGINRAIFKIGMKEFRKTKIPSFAFLNQKFDINSQSIGFSIAPIINSAGRIEDASLALSFFEEKEVKNLHSRFNCLIEINENRKQIQDEVFEKAKNNFLNYENFIISYGENWNEGVLGIVASKLADYTGKTAFCLNKNNGMLKGSGRSRGGINLIDSIQKCKDFLIRFGGHSGAVGLNMKIENILKFASTLDSNIVIESRESEEKPIYIEFREINKELINLIRDYEPYGKGNKEITFESKNIKIISSRPLNKNNKYKKLQLSQDGIILEALQFNKKNDLESNSKLECTFNLSYNAYGISLFLDSIQVINS